MLIYSVGRWLSRRAPPRGPWRVLMRMAPGVPKLSGSGMVRRAFRPVRAALYMVAKPIRRAGEVFVRFVTRPTGFQLEVLTGAQETTGCDRPQELLREAEIGDRTAEGAVEPKAGNIVSAQGNWSRLAARGPAGGGGRRPEWLKYVPRR